MDFDAARTFVTDNPRGVLHTFRRDGSPQLSPNIAGFGADGRLWISSRETAYKVRNLRRDPRASWCAQSNEFYGQWLQLDGRAEIVSLPAAMEMLVDYYRSLSGEHPDWNDYRAAMQRDRRVIIAITVERVGPTRSG